MKRTSPLIAFTSAALLLAGGLQLLAPASDAAASKKTFSEGPALDTPGSYSPGPIPLDTTAHSLFFKITNTSTGSSAVPYGSAQIQVPAGFTMTRALLYSAPSNFFISGNVNGVTTSTPITVVSSGPTGTGIAPNGGYIIIEIDGQAAATGICPSTWNTAVKQSNDFSGTGNDFTGNSVATPVTNSFKLRWTTQPTDTQFDKSMSPAPAVSGFDACGNQVSITAGQVSLSDTSGGSMSATTGATTTSTTPTSVQFNTITFSTYAFFDTLTASASGFQDAVSNQFFVAQQVKDCPVDPTKQCSTNNLSDSNHITFAVVSVVNNSSSTQRIENSVYGSVSPDPNNPIQVACNEPSNVAPEVGYGAKVTVNVTTLGKTVVVELPRQYVNLVSNNGTPFMDLCMQLPPDGTPFFDKYYSPTNPYDNQPVLEGLLPDCSVQPLPNPCISNRSKNAGNEYITATLPPGDPTFTYRG